MKQAVTTVTKRPLRSVYRIIEPIWLLQRQQLTAHDFIECTFPAVLLTAVTLGICIQWKSAGKWNCHIWLNQRTRWYVCRARGKLFLQAAFSMWLFVSASRSARCAQQHLMVGDWQPCWGALACSVTDCTVAKVHCTANAPPESGGRYRSSSLAVSIVCSLHRLPITALCLI